MDIKPIRIDSVNIPETPRWLLEPSIAVPPAAPVTQQVGVPIIDIPGCVEAHEQDDGKNKNLTGDDPKGVKVYCDGQVPSFNPIDYDRNKLKYEYEAPIPPVNPPPDTKTPATPEAKTPKKPACPTREQQLKNPVGKILEGNKKITGYEVVGKECLMVTEKLTIPDQILGNVPNAGKVTATASIAVVATASALLAKPLADLLLKAVKPTVKKVMKKISALRGKKIPPQSVQEKRQEQRIRNHAIRKLKGKE